MGNGLGPANTASPHNLRIWTLSFCFLDYRSDGLVSSRNRDVSAETISTSKHSCNLLEHLFTTWLWRALPRSHNISESTVLCSHHKRLVSRVPATQSPIVVPRQAKGFPSDQRSRSRLLPDRSVVIHIIFVAAIFLLKKESMPILPRSDSRKARPPPPSFCMNVKRKGLQNLHFVNAYSKERDSVVLDLESRIPVLKESGPFGTLRVNELAHATCSSLQVKLPKK